MRLFILTLFATTLVCCSEETKTPPTVLQGTISNASSDKLTLIGFDFREEIALDTNGNFSDTLDVETGYFKLYEGRNGADVFISKGSTLTILADASDYTGSITFEGPSAPHNVYLVKKTALSDSLMGSANVYLMEEDSFLMQINLLNEGRINLLKDQPDLPAEFTSMEEKNIDYAYLTYLERYPSYHEYYAKKEGFEASESVQQPLADIDYDNEEEYRSIPTYRDLVHSHFGEYTYGEKVDEGLEMLKKLTAPSIINRLAKDFAYGISPGNEKNELLFETLSAVATDSTYLADLETKFEKVQKLKSGSPSPAFEDYEDHSGGTKSLSDFKGKFVYIDVWATWCGPCLREIPSLLEVEKKYHDKNIHFVSISIDKMKDREKWIQMVTDKELGGSQLMADKDWESDFVEDYVIDGIPRFILLDPEGNIVSGDAPRPSDEKLIEMFESNGI